MFYDEIRIKQDISYISLCPLRILQHSKFIIMATFLGTNAVVVMRVHCTKVTGMHGYGYVIRLLASSFLHVDST